VWRQFNAELNPMLLDRNLGRLNNALRRAFRQRFMVNVIADLSVLICFGAMFPPLAFVIAISLCVDCWEVRLGLGRFQQIIQNLSDSEKEGQLKRRLMKVRDQMIQEYIAAEEQITHGVWFGLCITSGIWAFVLFDISSSSTNTFASLLILVIMALTPYTVIGAFYLKRLSGSRKDNNKVDDLVTEKTTVINPVFGTDTSSHWRKEENRNSKSQDMDL
jgi:tetrahydromethanopterin S-methyltransferase subunit E